MFGTVERVLNFSTSKTVNMIFRKRNKEPMKITLRNQIIPYQKRTQFLGMTLDIRLNWEEHIDRVRIKAKRPINITKVITGKKWGGDQKNLKIMYSAPLGKLEKT